MKRTIRVFSLLLAAVMLLSAQTLAAEPAQAFTDVSKQDYFYDAVNWAVEKEITSGVSKDVFAPNRDCTRADFVTFLWRAAGKPVVNYAMNFSDVKESSYYAEAVRWAASLGIVTGLSKNTFGAANAVTREQAVTMLWRFAKQQGFDTTQGGMAIREYADYDSLSEYAREAMAWAVNTEILKGSNNRLLPDAACTRVDGHERLLHRGAPEAPSGRKPDGGRVPLRYVPGSEGHPRDGRAGVRRGGEGHRPSVQGQPDLQPVRGAAG